MRWANFFHIYQPPHWEPAIVRRVTKESYRPMAAFLRAHPRIKITLNISGSLLEQLQRLRLNNVIQDLRVLVRRKQVELVGSAIYHAFLPLTPLAEARRQIERNSQCLRSFFGSHLPLRGFFPPEMAYSPAVATLLEQLGFHWMIIDEISLPANQRARFDTRYIRQGSSLGLVFRNRIASNYFAFQSSVDDPRQFWHYLAADGRCATTLLTAMDGENIGHHRPELRRLWQRLIADPRVRTVTISELLRHHSRRQALSPRRCTWASREQELRQHIPYVLWDDPHNPIHPLQWQLLKAVTRAVTRATSHPRYREARQLLDECYASDQFWWASAKPWWSVTIVSAAVHRLLHAATLVGVRTPEIKRLGSRIETLLHRWQRTGRFRRVTEQYLRSQPDDTVRYIGGAKITL